MRRLEFINGTIDGLMFSLRINEWLMIQLLRGQVYWPNARTIDRLFTHQFYAADGWQTPPPSLSSRKNQKFTHHTLCFAYDHNLQSFKRSGFCFSILKSRKSDGIRLVFFITSAFITAAVWLNKALKRFFFSFLLFYRPN